MYLRARYYAPYLNQFIQPDSIVPAPTIPTDWNRYSYTRNNPVNFVDRSGYITQDEAGTADSIVQVLQSLYNVHIKKDWGNHLSQVNPSTLPPFVLTGILYDCNWEAGLWTLDDLTAVNAGVHIMSAGIHFLGGHFNSLVGPVTIVREKGGRSTTDDANPGLVHYQVDKAQRDYKIYVAIHEMGHVTMFNNPLTLAYFMNKLGTQCLNFQSGLTGFPYCYTDKGPDSSLYYVGPDAGSYSMGNGYSNMPSLYSAQGDWEDYAETFRVVVVSAYFSSGRTNYVDDARLVYNYPGSNYNIGIRRTVMNAIINGSWKDSSWWR